MIDMMAREGHIRKDKSCAGKICECIHFTPVHLEVPLRPLLGHRRCFKRILSFDIQIASHLFVIMAEAKVNWQHIKSH